MRWKNIYRGMLMGVSDIVPGVSGGTIAVLLGIYDELIRSINNLLSKKYKAALKFLIPLAIGVVLALFTLSHFMGWLLLKHPVPTFFGFMGLIIGVLPFLFRESDAKHTFRLSHYVLLVIGIILIILLPEASSNTEIITDRGLGFYAYLFLAGILASAAMILPGISGSFILLVMGVYLTAINGLKELDFLIILTLGSGIVLGILLMSKIINYFLTHYRTGTFALIIGLVIGSIKVVFPGLPQTGLIWLLSVSTFILGLLIAYILGKIEYKDIEVSE